MSRIKDLPLKETLEDGDVLLIDGTSGTKRMPAKSFIPKEGTDTTASGEDSHAEGVSSTASGKAAHSEGNATTASGEDSHAEGNSTEANANHTHAEGYRSTASNEASHAEGNNTTASGKSSHAEGTNTTASGDYSHSEGIGTFAVGEASHAEGTSTNANNTNSHSEGTRTNASGESSHAEGYSSIAFGYCSHAEGEATNANARDSHAEGYNTTASGNYSHAEGYNSKAKGICSHAEGQDTEAFGYYSHAEGLGTRAGYCCHAHGKYNKSSITGDDYATIVGGGTDDENRKNIHTLDWNGNAKFAGDVYAYAESSRQIALSDLVRSTSPPNVEMRGGTIKDISFFYKYAGMTPGVGGQTPEPFYFGTVICTCVSSTHDGYVTISGLPRSTAPFSVRVTDNLNKVNPVVSTYTFPANTDTFQVGVDDEAEPCLIEFMYHATITASGLVANED